jgi:hypothetical protein
MAEIIGQSEEEPCFRESIIIYQVNHMRFSKREIQKLGKITALLEKGKIWFKRDKAKSRRYHR